ncbi:MAG: hypothetical protein HUU54_07990 [Ignavibacteriaceae bacterium]|nr:hypothetical protein [Ignavibacteriaceae bacterium]
MMKNNTFVLKTTVLFSVFALAVMVLFTGCEKKEEPKQETTQVQPAPEAPPPAPVVKVEGTWKGTFWNKSMTLVVAKQTEGAFEGETTILWPRNTAKSKVTGTIDGTTLAMKFEDVEKHKDAGTYEGTLSADMKTFTGKFTLASNPKSTFDVKLNLQ